MNKLKGLFKLLRFELPFSAGICVIMGQMLALGDFASLKVSAFAFFSVFSISASILVLNDYFDVETDKINAPHRPIPSNIVSQSEALLLSIVLLIAGISLSFMLNYNALITTIILLVIGFLYNRKYKKSGLTGNLMVSLSVGMTFVFGGISVGLPNNIVVWFFGIIAALIDLGEEIAADSMDIQGDKLINSNSLAIKFGKRMALNISFSIFLIVIVLTCIPFVLKWFSPVYLIPIAIMDVFIGYSALKLVRSQDQEGRKYIRWLYLGSTLGLIVFITMRFLNF